MIARRVPMGRVWVPWIGTEIFFLVPG